jgi:hypothetical protein
MSYSELTELLQWLKTLDEITLLELLEINSEDLVESFTDKIVEQQDKFIREYVKNKQDNIS